MKGASPALSLTGPDGQTVPDPDPRVDPLRRRRPQDGTRRVHRPRCAGDGIFDVSRLAAHGPATPTTDRRRSPRAPPGPQVQFENELYRIALDGATGAITSLHVKTGDWEVLSGPGNVVAREQDRGDLWELYKGLDGGSRVAMTTQQKVPRRGQAVFSDEGKGEPGTVITGPVFSELRVARPFGSGRFATTVRVYAGLRRIEITTQAGQSGEVCPLPGAVPDDDHSRARARMRFPFGSIDRPAAIEFPAQNWVDHGDGRHGLAVLNIGLPGNLVTDGTMMVSLLRAHTLGAYGFGGGYEPGMSSDSGYQLGQERTMQYALVPHAGDWREAGVFRDGLELNHPLDMPQRAPSRWLLAQPVGTAGRLQSQRCRLVVETDAETATWPCESTRPRAGRPRA